MRQTIDLLAEYATYHRDQRNIATHFVGVPLIVFAVGLLLARPEFSIGGMPLTPAWAAAGLATLWYLTRGHLAIGAATAFAMLVLVGLAHRMALSVDNPFAWGLGLFAVGWAIQFVGHWYEGRKPAFVDDLVGLLVGPMFVTAEALFALGWMRPVLAEIERRAGPTYLRDMAHPA